MRSGVSLFRRSIHYHRIISKDIKLLSVSGAFRNFERDYGYGVAAWHILQGLTDNDIKWAVDDPNMPIELFWGHPPYEFQRSYNYKIGYTAWESTGFRKGWIESMQEADEIWTPTPWLSDHFEKTLDKPTFTYPHGVSDEWEAVRHNRPNNRPFTFLHIGEPQFRKNGQLVVDAFSELYGNDPNYRLVMKSGGINTTRIYTHSGSIVGTPNSVYSNITLIESMLSFDQMLGLHHQVDALLYPSVGEGFGFHPLEAMAAGLPTISTSNWAIYDKYITVPIEGVLSPCEWQDLHPGDVFNVTKDQVKTAMIDMVENYDKYAGKAYKNSFFIHDEYSWKVQNNKAAEKIKFIAKSRI